jgi:hypothetical protein
MQLKICYWNPEKVTSWNDNWNKGLPEAANDFTKGVVLNGISCREALYSRIKKAQLLSDFSTGNARISMGLGSDLNYSAANRLVEGTVFKNGFKVSKDGWVYNYKDAPHPSLFSLLAFILPKYAHLYSKDKPNIIPLEILDSIIDTRLSHYRMDFIFTAFMTWIALNKKYDVRTENALKYSTTGEPNGPGRFAYFSFYRHYFYTDLNGDYPAFRWWKFTSVKSRLKQILSKLSEQEAEFIKNLIGE